MLLAAASWAPGYLAKGLSSGGARQKACAWWHSREGQASEAQAGANPQPMLNMNTNKFTDGGSCIHGAEAIWLE